MKSLLKDNPLGIALLALASVLLLLSLLLPVFSGGLPAVNSEAASGANQLAANMTELNSLEPIEEYVVISQRPMFNQDRKPVDISKAAESADEDTLAATAALDDNPLEVDLTGVIITADQRIAMLWDRANKTTMSLAEGEVLEGDLSNWQVKKVEARKVSFKNQKGKIAELELLMFTDSLGKPPAVSSKTGQRKATAESNSGAAKNTAQQKSASATNKANAEASKAPMSAADFMRASLEKRKAARKSQQDKSAASTKK